MAKPGQAQDEAMDAILASIRSMMSEDADNNAAHSPEPLPDNVSSLFTGAPVNSPGTGATTIVDAADEDTPRLAIDHAIDSAMGDARESIEAANQAANEPPVQHVAMSPVRHDAPVELSGQPLMSPDADAAVAKNFNALAAAMLSGSGRTVDGMVEDILRPMLRDWLDANLPPLVERLVREEIERVSRGRR